jgi:glyoxylase-like metal-dependent hydrolase (beta-lactamase superfamily II)
VIHAGDIFFNGFYPFIDVQHGGSVKGMVEATDTLLTLADSSTKIIAGHGPLGDKAQLASYRLMLATAYERLKALKEDGKTVEEAVDAKPLADLEATWGDGLFKGERWIELVYPGVY